MAPDLVDNKDIARWYGSLGYDGSSPDWGMNWHLSYYNVLDQNQWNYPEATYGYTSATTEQHTQGIRSQFSLPTFSFGRLLLGFDWDGIDVSSYTNPAGFPWSPDCHYDNPAFFAEEKIDWNKLTLLLGIRYDYFPGADTAHGRPRTCSRKTSSSAIHPGAPGSPTSFSIG